MLVTSSQGADEQRIADVYRHSLAEVLESIEEAYSMLLWQKGEATESPIERLFLIAMLGHCIVETEFEVIPQVQIDKYRVDFVVTYQPYRNAEIFSVVVECDGHDYHERTKEQAKRDKARDRQLLSKGFPVLRFTGSEIYADPAECVADVVEHLIEAENRRRGRA